MWKQGHSNRLDALICDQVVHDRSQLGALQVILPIVNDQQRDWSLHWRPVEIDLALVIITQPLGFDALSAQGSNPYIRAANRERRGHALRHVKEVVVAAYTAVHRTPVQGIEKFFLRDGIIESILNIGVARQGQGAGPDTVIGTGPKRRGEAFERLGTVLPAVQVADQIWRRLPLPDEPGAVSVDDGVARISGALNCQFRNAHLRKVPINSPFARMWPSMALSNSPLSAPVESPSISSSAYSLKK